MRTAIAIFLFVHAFAHLAGFAGAWRLAGSIPYRTTVLDGTFDIGDLGMRALGILWLLVAFAFAVAGTAALYQLPSWPGIALVVSLVSLALCIVGWPDARIGAIVDVALIALLLAR
jgi:hypothetical protein